MRHILACLLILLPITASAQNDYLIDWDAVGEEASQILIDLVRIDSSNADSAYKGPLCQERDRRSELKPGR